jgi:hypothetical protein
VERQAAQQNLRLIAQNKALWKYHVLQKKNDVVFVEAPTTKIKIE